MRLVSFWIHDYYRLFCLKREPSSEPTTIHIMCFALAELCMRVLILAGITI
jgi:hypothetical protein